MDAERYRELIVREVLADLTVEERADLERELRRRGPDGQAEVDALREVIGSLGLAAAPRTPPPELRERILAAASPSDATTDVGGGTAPLGAAGASRPVGRRRTRDMKKGGRLWPWVAIAATLAALALGLNSLRLQDDLRSARASLTTARERADQADVLRDSLSELVADVSTLLDANPVTLSATSPDVVGRARVFLDMDTGRTLVLVDELPVLPPDRVYQLWSIRDGQPSSAGAFRLESEGPAWIHLEESTELEGADLLAVTVEPAPGVTAPTSSPILAGGI